MIFVTGAGGNVGSAVLESCAAAGLEAIGGERRGGRHRRFDFEDRSTWDAVQGCDQLFLLRPPPISRVETTLNPFVDHARRAGVRHVVFLSVQGAESNPRVPHHAVERHLAQTGADWTFLRPGFFAQNFASAYRADVLEHGRLYVPAGAGEVAFIDVRDLGDVAARIFAEPEAHRGRAWLLTGPSRFTFTRAAELLTELSGRPIRYVAASIPGYLWHLLVRRRLSPMHAVVQTVLHVGLRRGDAARVDDGTLATLLGRRPRDLEQYLRDFASSWAAQPR